MTWFERLVGFSETSADDVRSKLILRDEQMQSIVNQRSMTAGTFTTPALRNLREDVELPPRSNLIRIREVVGDVRALHENPQNSNSVFQVASQFNCLEMASPSLTPEYGVGIYENDRTQGPTCCICAGAGTIYRNYFVELGKQRGQSKHHQIDCLAEIGQALGNTSQRLWQMENGYCFPTLEGLQEIETRLQALDDRKWNNLLGKLSVGVQAGTEVTSSASNHAVTQVLCSGLPLAYSEIDDKHWDYFPRLILNATYESTLYVAYQNLLKTGCPKLFLTLVGGGVFGNHLDWILAAIERSLRIFSGVELDVNIVSYRSSNPDIAALVSKF